MDAFAVGAIDYLLKPLTTTLARAVARASH